MYARLEKNFQTLKSYVIIQGFWENFEPIQFYENYLVIGEIDS